MNIIIKKSKCTINPLPESRLGKFLEHRFSYKKQGSHFMPNPQWAIVKLYKIKTGIFPIGFLKDVINVIEEYNRQYNIYDTINITNKNYCTSVRTI